MEANPAAPPGSAEAAGTDTALTDHETAEAIRDGKLGSPQKYGDFWLFDMRITGTGAAFRDSLNEWALRDPEVWLTDKFIQRCAGLPVIFGHPEASGLNDKEFKDRVIGTIILPYRKDDEVRGVAKIFEADAALLMQTTHRSTSPGVLAKGEPPVELKDGTKVLDEGLPLVLDHLAVCEAGVWDKDGPPDGIRLDALPRKDAKQMADEDLEKIKQERDDAKAKLDEYERRDAAFKEAEEKARTDAEESDREELAEAERGKADAKKRDARKDRHAKHDGDIMDCSRCDAEEDEDVSEVEGEEKKEKAQEDSKKDAAAAEKDIDADRGKHFNDSKRVEALEREIASMKRRQEAMSKPLSIADRNEIAKAFQRADSIYQMHGEPTPHHFPGESPISFRRRLADGLRKFDKSLEKYLINDAVDATTFELVENAIYDKALAAAKSSVSAGPDQLRPIHDKVLGKDRVSWVGDHRAAWVPFMPPMKRLIVGFTRDSNRGVSR